MFNFHTFCSIIFLSYYSLYRFDRFFILVYFNVCLIEKNMNNPTNKIMDERKKYVFNQQKLCWYVGLSVYITPSAHASRWREKFHVLTGFIIIEAKSWSISYWSSIFIDTRVEVIFTMVSQFTKPALLRHFTFGSWQEECCDVGDHYPFLHTFSFDIAKFRSIKMTRVLCSVFYSIHKLATSNK
jgi:hypothetical protein